MHRPPGQNIVAVVERWPLVEVRLYYFIFAFFRTVKASVKRARRIEPQPLACFALALRSPEKRRKISPVMQANRLSFVNNFLFNNTWFVM